jgi:uncharacterized protein (DUF305 family)
MLRRALVANVLQLSATNLVLLQTSVNYGPVNGVLIDVSRQYTTGMVVYYIERYVGGAEEQNAGVGLGPQCVALENSTQMICSALFEWRVVWAELKGMASDEFSDDNDIDIDCRYWPRIATGSGPILGIFIAGLVAAAISICSPTWTSARQTGPDVPVIVQPGAPGKPSKTLPASTKATLPPRSQADVEFMQGMIMHHGQAVEMTALIASHTENKNLRALGARISSSQSDEIKFMKRWLAARGEASSMGMAGMSGMDASGGTMALMPGMLTAEQMESLRNAKGAEFDRLFLTGMIQHHNGALTMVKDLFDTAGAGQDAEIFNFATDADNTQRAEIKIMQSMLEK